MLGEENGSITFYVTKNLWCSSIIKRHPKAKAIQVPMKRFDDELACRQPSFLIIDIEGGEQDFICYARLDGVSKPYTNYIRTLSAQQRWPKSWHSSRGKVSTRSRRSPIPITKFICASPGTESPRNP